MTLCLGLAVAAAAPAQNLLQIQVNNNPVPPGGQALVTIYNTQPLSMGFVGTAHPLHAIRVSGELAFPYDQVGQPVTWISAPSAPVLSLSVPASGLGSGGSFVLHYMDGEEAVTRLDVGTPAASFPRIHFWPAGLHDHYLGHGSPNGNFGQNAIKVANTGPGGHTLGPNDMLYVFGVTNSAPIASLSLAGIQVPAGRVVKLSLPPAALVPRNLKILVVWSDPDSGQMELVDFGLRPAGSLVDLHFPDGRKIPVGGTLPVRLSLSGWPAGAVAAPPIFIFALSLSVGELPLLPGISLPLNVQDNLVWASFASGAYGLMSGNVGQAVPDISFTSPVYAGRSLATGIVISHPNLPSLAGTLLHAAGFAFDPVSGQVGASQPEELFFQ